MAGSLLLQGKNIGWLVDDDTGGAFIKLIASVFGNYPATWYYDYQVLAQTADAAFTDTSDVSAFLPVDTLQVTKSAGVTSASVTIRLRPGSLGVVIISGSGAETFDITATVNGIAGVVVSGYIAGALTVLAPLSALGDGTHYIRMNS